MSGYGIGRVDGSGNATAYVSAVNPNGDMYTSVSGVALGPTGDLYAVVNGENFNPVTGDFTNENLLLHFASNWTAGGAATTANIMATLSQYDSYTGLAFDPAGQLYLSQYDGTTSQILKWNAGTGSFGAYVTMPATQVAQGFSFDPAGNLYIATETATAAVWRVAAGTTTPVSWVTQTSADTPLLPVGVLAAPPTALWGVDAAGVWSGSGNWIGSVPNEADAVAVLGNAITAPRTITLSGDVSLGELRLESAVGYTLSGAVTLHFATTGGNAAVNVLAGSHTIAVQTVAFESNTALNVAGGTGLSLTGAGGVTVGAGVTMTTTGTGMLSIAGPVAIGKGGTLALGEGAGQAVRVGSVGVSGTGALDVGSTGLVITGMSLTNAAGLIHNGGLKSSVAAGSGGLEAVGSLTGAEYQARVWDGGAV